MNEHEFIDENGNIVNPFCNLDLEDVTDVENFVYGNLTFPSEMSAETNGTHIYWRNLIPSKRETLAQLFGVLVYTEV